MVTEYRHLNQGQSKRRLPLPRLGGADRPGEGIKLIAPAERATKASAGMDRRKRIVYNRTLDSGIAMLKTFADAETKTFFETGKSRRLPREIHRRAAMRLTQLGAAWVIEDLRLPPSNRLEALRGDRAGQWSIRINDRWRICFTFAESDAYDVEIVDYH
jgi:proteic killer suppression protein